MTNTQTTTTKKMTKPAKKAMATLFSRMLWLARGASLAVGLAVVMALIVGLASTALAGTGVGARFDLGKTNTVNAITKLIGSVAGPSLQIDNGSTNASATALDLRVEPGKAPLKVNSGTRVANLNADKLDGKDAASFTPRTYEVAQVAIVPSGSSTINGLGCDVGDVALSGGFAELGSSSFVSRSDNRFTGNEAVWIFAITNNGNTDDQLVVSATCADYGAPHQQ